MTANEDSVARQAAGRWLREQRRRHGFETVGDLARALGVDPSRISSYETGKGKVPDERADQIAELFGMHWLTVRRGLNLWVPPTARGEAGEAEEPIDELERVFRRYRDDPGERGTVLRGLLSTWDENDEGEEAPDGGGGGGRRREAG